MHCLGKGRKDRTVPLWEDTSRMLTSYMERHGITGPSHVFAGRNVAHLTCSGAKSRSRIGAVAKRAAERHPDLTGRRITPHTFRHAMAMPYAGVDIATVAIWLSHESANTTHRYVAANMKAKEGALEKARVDWGVAGHAHYRATQSVLDFLNSL